MRRVLAHLALGAALLTILLASAAARSERSTQPPRLLAPKAAPTSSVVLDSQR